MNDSSPLLSSNPRLLINYFTLKLISARKFKFSAKIFLVQRMEASSVPPSDFNDQTPPASASDGAAKFLADLPSRGFFSSTVLSSNPKQKGDSSLKDRKANTATECPRKRTADRALDSRAKRAMTNSKVASRHEVSKSLLPAKDLQSLTVERIRGLLKEKGLSLRGRKDELIARLKGANE